MPRHRDRYMPWSALSWASLPARSSLSTPPSTLAVTPPVSLRTSSPFGPFAVTVLPSVVTVTPEGTGIGILPTRDMGLPDLAEDFAADAGGTRLAVGHHAARRGQDGDAH